MIKLFLNKVPNNLYNVPIMDFKYDVIIVFYKVPTILVLRCSCGHDVTIHDVLGYNVNSSSP